eukprot:SAG11_NODE_3778_length_2233_cov_1.310216_2_plen_107_part_00
MQGDCVKILQGYLERAELRSISSQWSMTTMEQTDEVYFFGNFLNMLTKMSIANDVNAAVFCSGDGSGGLLSHQQIVDFIFDRTLHPYIRVSARFSLLYTFRFLSAL